MDESAVPIKIILRSDIAPTKQHRYFKDWEEQLPEDEFKKRKKEYFLGRLFYNRLCNLVTRIHDFQGTDDGPVEKEQRIVRLQEELATKKENDKRQLQRIASKYAQATNR